MSEQNLMNIEGELRRIRRALERIADAVAPRSAGSTTPRPPAATPVAIPSNESWIADIGF